MRKLFKFYKSYWDVAKELSDKDRLLFFDALMEKQFTGKEPKLTGMSNFAYVSQKHSIEAQIKGWEDKTNIKLSEIQAISAPVLPPSVGGRVPPIKPPSVQLEEEVKEEVKEELNKKSKKVFFKDCIIADKNKFKEAFPEWSRVKLAYYYDSAMAWSEEGNKKINWKLTISGWAKKDELEGKIIFEKKGAITNYLPAN